MPRTVLLVDEDSAALADLRRTLHGSTHRVLSARGARPAFEVLAVEAVDVIVAAETLSEAAGIEFLARVRLRHPNTVRILLAPESAAAATPEGTVHFALSHPLGPNDLMQAIAHGLEQLELLHETQRLLRAVRRQAREKPGCSLPRPR